MTDELYRSLARHLDDLPGGFPPSAEGRELAILRRLFTPDEARLALNLTLIPEPARVVARRAELPLEEASSRLQEMADKGLCLRLERPSREPLFMALQFAIGIWELQVNRLTPELVEEVDAYLPTLLTPDNWGGVPQLRTIPVGRSLQHEPQAMPHERAEVIIRSCQRIALAPCICRRERAMVGEGCGRLEDGCLVFGTAASMYVRNGLARWITVEEALEVLAEAERHGMVLQPGNSMRPSNICCCCSCCCGVLRNVRTWDRPGELLASPFRASLTTEICTGCGVCVEACPMDALSIQDRKAALALHRCIGCGVCVPRCPQGALALERRPHPPPVPARGLLTNWRLGRARGRLPLVKVAGMLMRAGWDRARAR